MPPPTTPSRKTPGLASIQRSREERQRGKYNRPTAHLLLLAVLGVLGSLVVYRFVSARELGEAKAALVARQRAVALTVGKEWAPLRDRIEQFTAHAASGYEGDLVTADARHLDFESQPTVYLRLRVADARDIASIRRAAADSLRDAFAGCLLRVPASAAARGQADAGAFPDQPWSLRQAYAATRVLQDDWARDVGDAGDRLRLRVFERQFDRAVREEIPLAVDVVKNAQFFLLVLDEDVDAARELTDGGAASEEALQLVAHPARVHVLGLRTGTEIVRLRRVGEASFVPAGEHRALRPEVQAAMQRQVNNCDLAQQVRQALASSTSR